MQETQIGTVAKVYLRGLARTQSKFMSDALKAVANISPALASTSPNAASSASAPTAAPAPAPVLMEEGNSSAEEEEWDTGAGWEIPLGEIC